MMQFFQKGGPVMWPLLLCSIIAVAAILERLVFWVREGRTQDPKLLHHILHLTERGLFDEAVAQAKASRDAVARVLLNGLTHHHFSMEGALEVAVHAEISRMKRFLAVLDTIITVAPLLGIFGTVTGILTAFGALEGKVPDVKVVSTGIAEAVITTVAGLAIAIPSVIAYNYYASRVEAAAGRITTHASNFEILYKKGQGKHAN